MRLWLHLCAGRGLQTCLCDLCMCVTQMQGLCASGWSLLVHADQLAWSCLQHMLMRHMHIQATEDRPHPSLQDSLK